METHPLAPQCALILSLAVDSAVKKKVPKPTVFLPTLEEVEKKKSGTYICLLEDFFPNVVKTYWKDEKSRQLDAQLGPITKVNGLYSQVSWLTVQEDTQPKNLTYYFQHEESGIEPVAVRLPSISEVVKENHSSNHRNKTEGIKVLKENHSSNQCNKTEVGKELQELHFANTSAIYTYMILLVKSTIYFTITLFFLYQKRVAWNQGTK